MLKLFSASFVLNMRLNLLCSWGSLIEDFGRMTMQEQFPHMFDRRRLYPKQLVRVKADANTTLRGLWAILAEVGDDYVSAMVLVSGDDPQMVTLPRTSVESFTRTTRRVSSR